MGCNDQPGWRHFAGMVGLESVRKASGQFKLCLGRNSYGMYCNIVSCHSLKSRSALAPIPLPPHAFCLAYLAPCLACNLVCPALLCAVNV